MTTRNRNAADQAKILRDNVVRSWGKSAWARFSEPEKERLLAHEFMAMLGGQRNLARAIPTHDRNVRRWVAGDGEPSAEALEGARAALVRRGEAIAEALGSWPEG